MPAKALFKFLLGEGVLVLDLLSLFAGEPLPLTCNFSISLFTKPNGSGGDFSSFESFPLPAFFFLTELFEGLPFFLFALGLVGTSLKSIKSLSTAMSQFSGVKSENKTCWIKRLFKKKCFLNGSV